MTLAGRDPELVVVMEDADEALEVIPGEEQTGRISLRLPESLKNSIEAAAAQEGISTNSWIVRALQRRISRPSQHRRGRNRLQGYAQG